MINSTMNLSATFLAAPYDDGHEMAYFYCLDKNNYYELSISRYFEASEVEIVVRDQIKHRVQDLKVTLNGTHLDVFIDAESSKMLDNHTHYSITLKIEDSHQEAALHEALAIIFEGKRGLEIQRSPKPTAA